MGIRRSIILTAFGCGEMVLVSGVIYTLQSTLNESHSWNKALLGNKASTSIESLFNCHDNNSVDSQSQCCNTTKFDRWKFKETFETMRKHTRPTREMSFIIMPLIVSLSFLLLASILELPIVQARLMTMRTNSINTKGGCHATNHRLLEIFAFVVWMGDAAMYIFAIVVANLVRPKFSPSPYTLYDGCKSDGQKVKFTKDEIHCFRRLKVCSDLQEDSMIAVIILLLSALLCVVSKFNFRFCLTDTDDDLLDCQHGQRPCQCHRGPSKKTQHVESFQTSGSQANRNGSDATTTSSTTTIVRVRHTT